MLCVDVTGQGRAGQGRAGQGRAGQGRLDLVTFYDFVLLSIMCQVSLSLTFCFQKVYSNFYKSFRV
jgi:hypothetical protein